MAAPYATRATRSYTTPWDTIERAVDAVANRLAVGARSNIGVYYLQPHVRAFFDKDENGD